MSTREVRSNCPYPLASRQNQAANSVITVHDIQIGTHSPTIIAGPCSVESLDQIVELAKEIQAAGAQMLRGGAFKPRSSPYSFQGLGDRGLYYLAEARKVSGLPVVSEIMEASQLDTACDTIDVIQIGARNMQNYSLLKAVGRTDKPVLLKRGFSCTIEEWLMSAEYILSEGNQQVILCERGIRTFETATRNTLDLSAVPVVKERSHLPILVDPSHGTGVARYVPSMSMAALAAGCDGLLIEVHSHPEKAASDGQQTITPEELKLLIDKIHLFYKIEKNTNKEVALHG
ncbi:3-deoxy-7-phosphoheptulonate synthase [Alicyclobacillus sp. TC]|uniref:3-deoxy-7-phosphoheptulonate synthase n=1 Tax=Alicyclobacillus sp. TC TaxID=2606450 RepID=UPI001932722F|nr:3-deoxy-7-phosphoheptulonate synthase [Alicyclobacillus sp. TC]QRF22748.1 3-deoxy-7-phosphoheptulonate synthase [Alicyclobacillus sp. TC]